MKYEFVISGTPKQEKDVRRDGIAFMHTDLQPDNNAPLPAVRRFPPVLQVLTRVAAHIEQQLRAICIQSYKDGKNLKGICSEVYHFAQALGFEATIGVQEVYSASMPSFPGQTVISALLMVDLKPARIAQKKVASQVNYAS